MKMHACARMHALYNKHSRALCAQARALSSRCLRRQAAVASLQAPCTRAANIDTSVAHIVSERQPPQRGAYPAESSAPKFAVSSPTTLEQIFSSALPIEQHHEHTARVPPNQSVSSPLVDAWRGGHLHAFEATRERYLPARCRVMSALCSVVVQLVATAAGQGWQTHCRPA